MRYTNTVLLVAVIFSTIMFNVSLALADAGTTGTSVPELTGWPALAMIVCMITSYVIRRFTPGDSRFQTTAAKWALAGASALLSATTQVIASHGLSWVMIQPALVGAIMSWLAADNPSKTDPGRLRAMLPLILLPALLSTGCAAGQKVYIGALKFEAASSEFLGAAYIEWLGVDRRHQDDILVTAKTISEFQTRLLPWRAERDRINKLFTDARDALAVLDGSLRTVDAAKQRDFTGAIAGVASAFAALGAALARHGINLKQPSIASLKEKIHWRDEDACENEPCREIIIDWARGAA